MSAVFLGAGYAVALVVATRLIAVYRERRWWWLMAMEAATLAVVAGHALEGRAVAVAVNAVLLVAFGALWWWTGARRPRSPASGGA